MKKIILISLVFLSSCKNESLFEQSLINDKDNTYWVEFMMDSTGNYKYNKRQSVFFSNSRLSSLSSENEDRIGTPQVKLIEGGNQEKWSYNEKNNTLTTSYRTTFKIERYTKDTIFMKLTTGRKEKFIMIRKRLK
ncbi:hypothetical protein [Flavobacterium limi]|uniref:Lipocalin-like domain-containing protein n=1 Tax=Flavobacterium limi TaxID=2045105 RepID=A0ABQ1UYH9_9FLAO|nr:hypothetical protein [Flavobacterium limi]GGF30517.1 hypothetical protein GCM10011518_44700 [Flavobacterium limi]